MREIKFRAWDICKKVFIPVDIWAICQTDFNAFGVMLKDWENYKEGEYFYEYTHILGQYTGLKDRNGKEIYEFDLIKDSEQTYIVRIGEHINEAFDIADIYGVWLEHVSDPLFNGALSPSDCAVLEVMGNIYENPELLK